tara:strand:- start:239 stop:952 length:714 start_codon:yes stop_codon:yes gene_type:complete
MIATGIIPARYGSSRFPGKPLAQILGKSMIQRVYEQSVKCSKLSEVLVATDDKRIYDHVISFGGKVIMTSKKHISGTERCNEILEMHKNTNEIIVNIQGDEPYIHPKQIEEIINLFNSPKTQICTLVKEITNHKTLKDTNTPKAIVDDNGMAINFCRHINSSFSNNSFYKHIGLYGYRAKTLQNISKLRPSENEEKENLEQLRWIDNGYKIKVGITTYESISVDVPEDIKIIEAKMR